MTFDVEFIENESELQTKFSATNMSFDTKMGEGSNTAGVADQTYDPESENAQSGIAVAEAIEQILIKMREMSKISSVILYENQWEGVASPYSQVVNISGATKNSKIDLNPTVAQLSIFHNKDLAFVVENNSGVITVYCIGQKPTSDYTIQATITEVTLND